MATTAGTPEKRWIPLDAPPLGHIPSSDGFRGVSILGWVAVIDRFIFVRMIAIVVLEDRGPSPTAPRRHGASGASDLASCTDVGHTQ
jgi:hypothetical protein